jgi:hypothetical protein
MIYKLIAVTLLKRRIFKLLMNDQDGKVLADYKRDPNFLFHFALARYAQAANLTDTALDLSNHKQDYLVVHELRIQNTNIEMTLVVMPFQIKHRIDTMIRSDPSIRKICIVESDSAACSVSIVSSNTPISQLGGKTFHECVNVTNGVIVVTVEDFQSLKTLHDIVLWTHNPAMLAEIEERTAIIAKTVNSH